MKLEDVKVGMMVKVASLPKLARSHVVMKHTVEKVYEVGAITGAPHSIGLKVHGAIGMDNMQWYDPENLESAFKIGDRVQGIGDSCLGEDRRGKFGYIDGGIMSSLCMFHYTIRWDDNSSADMMLPMNLKLINEGDNLRAKILTEKVVLNGKKCRKITGFENILKKSELPGKYLDNDLRMFLNKSTGGNQGLVTFNGRKYIDHMSYKGDEYLDIIVDIEGMPGFYSYIYVNTIHPEETYQNILRACRESGEVLARIQKEASEKLAKEWHGTCVDEI